MNRTVKMKSTVFRYLFFNYAGFSKQSLQCKVLYIPISVGIKKWGGSLGVYPRPKHSPHQNHPATVTPPQPAGCDAVELSESPDRQNRQINLWER